MGEAAKTAGKKRESPLLYLVLCLGAFSGVLSGVAGFWSVRDQSGDIPQHRTSFEPKSLSGSEKAFDSIAVNIETGLPKDLAEPGK